MRRDYFISTGEESRLNDKRKESRTFLKSNK